MRCTGPACPSTRLDQCPSFHVRAHADATPRRRRRRRLRDSSDDSYDDDDEVSMAEAVVLAMARPAALKRPAATPAANAPAAKRLATVPLAPAPAAPVRLWSTTTTPVHYVIGLLRPTNVAGLRLLLTDYLVKRNPTFDKVAAAVAQLHDALAVARNAADMMVGGGGGAGVM